MIHNHGTEDGPGLACREVTLIGHGLIGVCLTRWTVACINWSHPTAPKAMAYLRAPNGANFEKYLPTHAEAFTHARKMARLTHDRA